MNQHLNAHRAPATLSLIMEVTQLLSQSGQTRDWFRKELNAFLPEVRRISEKPSGMVQIYRWLDPTSKNWPEPKAEIALAMFKFVAKHSQNH